MTWSVREIFKACELLMGRAKVRFFFVFFMYLQLQSTLWRYEMFQSSISESAGEGRTHEPCYWWQNSRRPWAPYGPGDSKVSWYYFLFGRYVIFSCQDMCCSCCSSKSLLVGAPRMICLMQLLGGTVGLEVWRAPYGPIQGVTAQDFRSLVTPFVPYFKFKSFLKLKACRSC